MAEETSVPRSKGVLGWIERTGNALPDPVFIFFILIAILMAISAVLAGMDTSVVHPVTGAEIEAKSLVSAENIRRLLVEMPATFAHFHPLGYVAVVMLGAGVAERSGLFGAAMRASVANAPTLFLTPIIAFVAMMANLAADAAYVVLIPLAGVVYAAAGRHPIAGIAAAFAGVSGGFSANLLPGQLDALLFGITQSAVDASDIHPGWMANIAGNHFFIIAMLVIYIPVIWFVTDRIIEPRLGKWTKGVPSGMEGEAKSGALDAAEKKGLIWAGVALAGVVALWLYFLFGQGRPLIDNSICPPEAAAAGSCSPVANLNPFYQSLVAGFFVLFFASAWAYGAAAGTIKCHRDVVKMMAQSMADLGYYFVLVFAVAHFVAMFNWSNLGLVLAVNGADVLEASGLPDWALLICIVLMAAFVNLFVGSASAKWALLAPILVPMLMLLGISPEMATAAYRVGDGATNIVTPLMVYFPLVLTFCQRWVAGYGLGSLMANMVPYSVWMLITGLLLVLGWTVLGLPLGGGAEIGYTLPSAG